MTSPSRWVPRPSGLPGLLYGVAYYPEQDEVEERREDPAWLTAAGTSVVRMADFAWSRLEPREGVFDFEWLDVEIERLAKVGIRTVLCTPTAAPPSWATHRQPEVLAVDHNGRSMRHGSRQHASLCSPVFQRHATRITMALARHYASNEAVVGWQIDNEFHCHLGLDWSAATRGAFQAWLQEKYHRVDQLNEAWGAVFWSQTYGSFEEVDLPYPNRPTQVNPHQWLDFRLFISDRAVRFQRAQVEILRAANPSWWITHNGFFKDLDYRALARDLDFVSLDLYPGFVAPAERAAWSATKLAQTASFKGNFLVAEMQSGAGAQGDFCHDTPLPGQMRLWAWQAVAHGADGVIFFRWRTCRFGAEQAWRGIIDHDNRRRARYQEYVLTGQEFAHVGALLAGSVRQPEVAVLYDTGLPEFGHAPVTHGLPSPGEVAEGLYRAAWSAGYDAGLVHPLDSLEQVRVLILPSMPLLTREVAARLETWVRQGGVLVVTARSARRDEQGHVYREPAPGPLRGLVGAEIEDYSRLNASASSDLTPLAWNGRSLAAHLWCEWLRPVEAGVVGKWEAGPWLDQPAVTVNAIGQGVCLYFGSYPTAEGARELVRWAAEAAGLRPLVADLPAEVEVMRRRSGDGTSWLFLLNHGSGTVRLPAELPGKPVLPAAAHGNQLEPFAVRINRVAPPFP